MCQLWKIVILLSSMSQKQVFGQPPIKIRTPYDVFMWRNVEIYLNEKYMYQQKALNTPITCHEYAYCQLSIMRKSDKEKLLHIFNNVRNSFASTRKDQTYILQLVWLWIAEIYSTLDSFACAPGFRKYGLLKDEDVNITKPNRTHPVYIQPDSSSPGVPIACDPLQMIFTVEEPNIAKFLIDFEDKLINNETYLDLLTDKFGKSLFTGCNVMFTRSGTKIGTTNVYLSCYFCTMNDFNHSLPISLGSNGFDRSSTFQNLYKDPQLADSFVNEDICLQYNCLKLNLSSGRTVSENISLILLCYLCASIIFLGLP